MTKLILNYVRHFLILCIVSLMAFPTYAQEDKKEEEKEKKNRFVALPAISYSPETKLTLGVIGYYFMDLSQGVPETRISNVRLIAVYTTAKQIILEPSWQIFTPGEKYIFSGKAFFNRYPDRNYGIGNDASNTVVRYLSEGMTLDTLNYLRFNTDRLFINPTFLRKIRKGLYAGIQMEIESLYRYSRLDDSIAYISPELVGLENNNITGLRSGIGLNVTYDTRKNVVNPQQGEFIRAGNIVYGGFLGSKYNYSLYQLDARKYFTISKKDNRSTLFHEHILALQLVQNFRFTNSADGIPIRGLSRLGGSSFIRGYFFGTYQDNHMNALQAEYRLSIWRFIGLVGFVGAGQTYGTAKSFSFSDYNLAAGGGLRLMLNKSQRLNVRIDYGFGLSDGSNYGSRQTGLYFLLSEAF